MRIVSTAVGLIIGLFVMTIVFGSWYQIDERERGVILRNGAVTGEASPGLAFKLPIVDSVVRVPLDTKTATFKDLQAYSRDQQLASIGLSVIFRIPSSQVKDLYSRFGDIQRLSDRVITPKVMERTKTVFGGYTAMSAIQDRGRLNADMANAISEGIKSLGAPVIVESVQIENIDFSDAYERSIEQRMLAEVEVQKLKQNAEREKVQGEIVVTQARAQADAVRQSAEAQAAAIKLRGEAEAQAIRARGAALGDNPSLVLLTQAERWDGKLPATMVPGAATPMLSIGK
jgi:regulator of protease activity HflC (stomatin/prohibitin superfamily)